MRYGIALFSSDLLPDPTVYQGSANIFESWYLVGFLQKTPA